MESSKFIQISDGILLEYIYTSQANPTELNTATYPIEIMRDGHTQGSYLFNTDSVSAEMGNYRDNFNWLHFVHDRPSVQKRG